MRINFMEAHMAIDPEGVIRPTIAGDKAELLDTKSITERVKAYIKHPLGAPKYFDAQGMAADLIVMIKLTSGGKATKEFMLQEIGAMWDNLDVRRQPVILQ